MYVFWKLKVALFYKYLKIAAWISVVAECAYK